MKSLILFVIFSWLLAIGQDYISEHYDDMALYCQREIKEVAL